VAKQDHTSFESTCVSDRQTLVRNALCNSPATEHPGSGALKILVLAQDLADAAIQRRAAMLCAGGAQVTAAGFRRAPQAVENVAGCPAIDFGQTLNARFLKRIISVAQKLVSLRRYQAVFTDADVIIARNLDMLVIATCGRSLCKPLPVLVYECLDIHRLMLNKGPVGWVLRWLERQLSRRAAAILTSSPAFVSHYFRRIARSRIPIRLVENKVLHIDAEKAPGEVPPSRRPGPPWVIGWFGMIRCTRSLRLLIELTQQSEGSVKVVIRGKPLRHLFGDFEKAIRDVPGIQFLGPYRSPQDLQNIYRHVHFNWAIDMFEEGLNSSWLLPNRLYEGGLYGSVPMAQLSVETGRLLKKLDAGVLLTDPLALSLRDFFTTLTPAQYHDLETAILSLPRANWLCDRSECQALIEWLSSLRKTQDAFSLNQDPPVEIEQK
jgi:succinoglycan biosynthesis protein ExoL